MTDHGEQPQASPRTRAGLDELQARLEELHRSVEELSEEGTWTPPAAQAAPGVPAAPQPPAQPQQPAGGISIDRSADVPQAAPVAPAPDTTAGGVPDPLPPGPPTFTETGAEPPPPTRAAQTASPAPEADVYSPAPEADEYVERPAAPSAPSGTIAHVDAGPFTDLIDLRNFEEKLLSLGSVNDVKVRRISRGRAQIELGMAGPYPLARELQRLDQELLIEPGPEGQVVVDIPAPVGVSEIDHPPEEQPLSPYARGDV